MRLSTSVENIHSITDVALQWVIALLATVQKENKVDSSMVQIASGASQGGVDVPALLVGDAVAFSAGEGPFLFLARLILLSKCIAEPL